MNNKRTSVKLYHYLSLSIVYGILPNACTLKITTIVRVLELTYQILLEIIPEPITNDLLYCRGAILKYPDLPKQL